ERRGADVAEILALDQQRQERESPDDDDAAEPVADGKLLRRRLDEHAIVGRRPTLEQSRDLRLGRVVAVAEHEQGHASAGRIDHYDERESRDRPLDRAMLRAESSGDAPTGGNAREEAERDQQAGGLQE